MPADELTPDQAMSELKELLRMAAGNFFLQRFTATRYTICREALLRSPLSSALPGYLRQCLTISRFHDFIHLYDPSIEARLAFIEATFAVGEVTARSAPRLDVFSSPDF